MQKRTRRPGYALATVLVLLGVAMFGIGALVSVSALESKISRSQQESVSAYYVADAGLADAMWRLNNDQTLLAALRAGTLNNTYTAVNAPQTGQGFTVTMTTDAGGAGYGLISVDAMSNNGSFVSQRQVQSHVFSASAPAPGLNTGNISVLSGGAMDINNGAGTVQLNNSDLYSRSTLDLSQAKVNLGTGKIKALGNYTGTGGTITSGGISAANMPPAPASVLVPSYDFTTALNSCNATYNGLDLFLMSIFTPTITLPGPVTCVTGDLSLLGGLPFGLTNLNVTGILVVNGNFGLNTVGNGSVNVVFTDPGTGVSGLAVKGATSISGGTWTMDGVMYTGGSETIAGTPSVTIRGGLFTGSSMVINPGTTFNVTLNTTRIANTLSTAAQPPSNVVRTNHW